MLFTYGPFSREAAQDRSPWVERSGTLGKNPRGVNPARGVGKQTHDVGAGALAPPRFSRSETPSKIVFRYKAKPNTTNRKIEQTIIRKHLGIKYSIFEDLRARTRVSEIS